MTKLKIKASRRREKAESAALHKKSKAKLRTIENNPNIY